MERVHLPKLLSEKFAISTSEARRLINQGAVGVDGRQILDFDPPAASLKGKKLTLGRRRGVDL